MSGLGVIFGALGLLAAYGIFMPSSASAFSGSGAGTSGDPYQITDCSQWLEIDNDLAAEYILTQDIDCASTTYAIVGSAVGTPFTGVLDGDGFMIKDVAINGTGDVGLFGFLDGATIRNLEINDGSFGSSGANLGALAGQAYGSTTITNVRGVSNTVLSTDDTVGGLVGRMAAASIEGSSSITAAVTGGTNVGGLVGYTVGPNSITNSLASGFVTGTLNVGGLVGHFDTGPSALTDSYSAVTFSSVSDTNGGLVGRVKSTAIISDVFSVADMTSGAGTNSGAAFGIIDVGASVTAVYFDQLKADRPDCASAGPVSCTDVNLAGEGNNYFKDTVTRSPLNNWSFGTGNIWHRNYNDYPSLSPLKDPYMLCNAPYTSTPSPTVSITADCQDGTSGWGTPTWEAQYKRLGTGIWIPLTLSDIHTASVTVNGLAALTDYTVRFRLTNDWGTLPWGRLEHIRPYGGDDSDGDGALDAQESAGPNGGDANADGTADNTQNTVASYVNTVTGKYTVLEVDAASSCRAGIVSSAAESSHSTADTAYSYPLGLMDFALYCTVAGSAPTVSQYFYDTTQTQGVVRKYNTLTQTYTTVTGATVTQQQIAGSSVVKISYAVLDNGPLDADELDNVIGDPAGFAVLASVSAPDTGVQSSLGMHSALLVAAGVSLVTAQFVRSRMRRTLALRQRA